MSPKESAMTGDLTTAVGAPEPEGRRMVSAATSIGALMDSQEARAVLTRHLPWVGDFGLAQEHPEFPVGVLLGLALGEDSPLRAAVLADLAAVEDPTVYPQRRPARPLARLSAEQQAGARIMVTAEARLYEPVDVALVVPGAGRLLADVEAAGEVSVVATGPDGVTVRSRVFHDRDDTLIGRFLPEAAGQWSVRVEGIEAADPLEAVIAVGPAREGAGLCAQHGPVRVVDGHFEHADGAAYTPFGTTAYAWIYSSEDLRERTLAALARSGFNKIRMCVFPKHYDFNRSVPQRVPFASAGAGERKWDWDTFDPGFFDLLEQAVRELGRRGVVADLILLHPYDRWGFSEMSPDMDESYLRHVVRRLSAFPNVFWSMANEYELLPAKRPEDWERLGRVVVEEDPVGHPVSVHNIAGPFDASAEWVSHVSFQGGGFEMASKVRELAARFGKPVVVDEYGYEGDLEHDWGNLTAQEGLRRFWEGVLAGAGMTHGETYFHEEWIWWANGGDLEGASWERIAFLRTLVEAAPSGRLVGRGGWGPTTGVDAGDPGAYQLAYLGARQPRTMTVTVPEGRSAAVDIIDTWAMTVDEVATGAGGRVEVALPGRAWMAVRVRCE
ncbi:MULTISPECIES: DUF5605 domain-containing protein [unclassified Actinomyces]|uniref:DUF5605 domain-containing protein n=1 Tax=unclassified Actinomyces TaxID=2609248 RepID=UPI002017BC59|nr:MULTISPECIES: DUF5605 domain-containing protein [unclassified Actinomyces]MCL3777410.1 DUF5605 domain-containing protein [Actinomyces sp. AC-20-1]MCL3789068.1 DUF5605 domain-containing protein [Actinomyces sp. 187325]MCL3792801.1 DUF5605 domain-containing protein [Actinomyces sp. 186855]MCL3793869.1 DUF5605 domain-containing protein [Actinomyces sp. 217892]